MTDEARTTEGKFQKGQSGNPAGRPVGARNRMPGTIAKLLDRHADNLADRLVERAYRGDRDAMKLCLDHVETRKGAPVPFDLPRLETNADAASAGTMIMEAVAAGELTPDEASDLFKLLDAFTKILKTSERAGGHA